MRNRCLVVAMLSVLGLAPPSLNAAEFDLDGYYKSFAVVYKLPDYAFSNFSVDAPPLGQVTNRLRLQGHLTFSDFGAVTVAYDLTPRVQDSRLWQNDLSFGMLERSAYRAYDFDRRLYPAEGDPVTTFGVLHNLDRAVVSISAGSFDLYLGRQAVAWGSGHAVNPTDVIAPYSYTELDTEDRVGVDGVRVRVPLGLMGELDGGYLFGDEFDFDKSAIFLRVKTYLERTDLSVMMVGFRENLMLGLDVARSVGGAGVWLEVAYVFDDALKDARRCACHDYGRLTLGADYSLAPTLYGFIEYHFSEAGSNDANDYLNEMTTPAFTEGAVYLMGCHYLIPGASWQITPLLTGSAEMLINLGDPSLLLAPRLEYSFAEDIYLAAGAYIGIGKRPDIEDTITFTDANLHLRSEFGTYPDVFYSSFRVYF